MGNPKVFIDKRIIKIQSDIQNMLNSDNGVTVHFEKSKFQKDGVKIKVITYNPKHDNFFLLCEQTHNTEIQAWGSVLENIRQLQSVLKGDVNEKDGSPNVNVGNSYTIVWSDRDNKRHTSYFYAKNEIKALEKLHYGKTEDSLTVFEVKLNPMS
jgi:hypothetical protein